VDSSDRDRMPVTRKELHQMLSHEALQGAILLVYANKQDKKSVMSAAEVSNSLGLDEIKAHDWHIQPCSALTGDGLFQGMEWLSQKLTTVAPQ